MKLLMVGSPIAGPVLGDGLAADRLPKRIVPDPHRPLLGKEPADVRGQSIAEQARVTFAPGGEQTVGLPGGDDHEVGMAIGGGHRRAGGVGDQGDLLRDRCVLVSAQPHRVRADRLAPADQQLVGGLCGDRIHERGRLMVEAGRRLGSAVTVTTGAGGSARATLAAAIAAIVIRTLSVARIAKLHAGLNSSHAWTSPIKAEVAGFGANVVAPRVGV